MRANMQRRVGPFHSTPAAGEQAFVQRARDLWLASARILQDGLAHVRLQVAVGLGTNLDGGIHARMRSRRSPYVCSRPVRPQ